MYCTNPECPDFLQSGIHGEYREGLTVCPKCDAPLVPERPHPPASEVPEGLVGLALPPLPGPLVALASFNFRQDADLVVSMLLANGVNAVVACDDCGALDPGLGFGTRARVLVAASQVEVASALLAQAEPAGPPGGA
jgi:hypothetical protein